MRKTKYKFLVLIAAVFFAHAQHGIAADVTGRAVFRGQEIILYADGTWEYAQAPEGVATIGEKCFSSQIIDALRICYDGRKYTPNDLGGDWEFVVANKRGTFFGGWIVEGTAIPAKTLSNIIIENVASAATGGRDGVAVRRNELAEVSGNSLRVLEYFAEIEGIPVTYLNYHGPLEGKGTIQILFFATGDNLDPFRDDIAELLAGIRIE